MRRRLPFNFGEAVRAHHPIHLYHIDDTQRLSPYPSLPGATQQYPGNEIWWSGEAPSNVHQNRIGLHLAGDAGLARGDSAAARYVDVWKGRAQSPWTVAEPHPPPDIRGRVRCAGDSRSLSRVYRL